MSIASKVKGVAAILGAGIEETASQVARYIEVTAPRGHRFTNCDLHSVVAMWQPEFGDKKQIAWDGIWDDIKDGVTRCAPGECEICDDEREVEGTE